MAPFCGMDFNTSPFHTDCRPTANVSMNQDAYNFEQGRITPAFANDDLEPVPIGAHRTPFDHAAQQSLLKESVKFLFGHSSPSPSKQEVTGALNKKRKRKSDCADLLADEDGQRFRPYQNQKWGERFEALKEFRRINGHCSVPYDYPPNPTLARWVKRQRYQYNLYIGEEPSAMTAERVQALEEVGFVWDTYTAAWERRINELRKYQADHGHTNVPSTYQANKKLASWIKCQRRQYKLFIEGKPSTLSHGRIDDLNRMGFQWEILGSRRDCGRVY